MAKVGRRGKRCAVLFFRPSADVLERESGRALQVDGARWLCCSIPGLEWDEMGVSGTGRRAAPRTSLSPEQTALGGSPRRLDATPSRCGKMIEPPVFAKMNPPRPETALLREGAELALLSGSGATVFGVFKDEEAARGAAAQFVGDQQLKTFVVRTCSGPLTVRETPFP